MRSVFAKMKVYKTLFWFISILFSCNSVFSLNILAVFPYQGKSHFFVFEPYLLELVKRGHNLTVISFFPQQKPVENYHDISLAGKVTALEASVPMDTSLSNIIQMFSIFYNSILENCKVMLEDKKVQNLWKSETKFDLVVLEQFNSDCSLGLAYKLGAPIVGMTSHVPMPWHYGRLGMQYNPSYIPVQFLEGGTKPTLYQRIERVIIHNFSNIMYKYFLQNMNRNQIQQYFDVPPLEEIAGDIKLIFLYTYFVVSGPSLLPPNVKEVGGFHVAKPKELPHDVRKFIEQSKNGVIFISFGSMVQALSMPKDKLEAIVAAISELPQRVVWKWDEKVLPGNPKNVYLSNWLPQNDILAHPNVLAFYSHGGMLSTTEAIHHGVPMIAMPIFGDQPANAAAVEESGLGVQIQIRDLTKENLLLKIKTVLDIEFRRNVKELSKIWHDRPTSAMDTAIYWTEFAARTKNFTFRSPATVVPLYQYLLLDVIAVALTVLLTTVFMFRTVLKLLKTPKQKLKKVKTN